MQHGYAAQTGAGFDEASLEFKRFILDKTVMFDSEPLTDAYRVSLLGEMMNRYDELTAQGLGHANAVDRVCTEFMGIARRMHEEGFALMNETYGARSSVWPQMTEDEAARYIEQSSERAHKKAMGAALCVGSIGGGLLIMGLGELLGMYWIEDTLGVAAMFVMIGIGVYSFFSASKPDDQERVKKGQFSLGVKLRKKLRALGDLQKKKAHKRGAKGIALIVTCLIPPILLDGILGISGLDTMGAGGMYAMVAAGVYELMMAKKEDKATRELLGEKDKK